MSNSEADQNGSGGREEEDPGLQTRGTTFLSKESSVVLFSESREQSIYNVDEQAHLAAHLATLPETSPNEGKPLVDSTGNIRHLSPRNVNVGDDQYYTAIKEDGTPLVREEDPVACHGKRRKKYSVGKLETPKPRELTQTESGREDTITTSRKDTEDRTDTQGSKKTSPEEVFPTEVDEEVLEAAKKRQAGLYEPAWLSREDRIPTMVELVSDRAEQHFQKGLGLAAEEQHEKAIHCYNKAINLKSKDVRFFVRRAESFLMLSDFQSAILNYKRACVLEPEREDFYNRLAFIYFFHGQCLYDQKLFPEALEAYSRATEMRPDVIGYHTRSIACLAALQRHGECLALVNKRLEVERENTDMYILRARLHQLFRNTTLCYYDVKDALSISPSHPEARALMSQLQQQAQGLRSQATQLNLLGRHRDALQKISLAIETDPAVSDHHVLRGALHRRLGDFNAAIDDYLLALDKTNHSEDSAVYLEAQRQLLLTYNDFAVECFTKGYYEEAIILLNKAIKGEKREKGLYINRGDCFFKEGNLQFAMADYLQALELDGVDTSTKARISVVHNEYGVQEFQDKNFQEAEKRFTQAIQNNPTLGNYYISRCRTRQMMENMTAARQDILLALLLDPSNIELMPIVTRLFPGKSIKDVLQSKAAIQARKALETLLVGTQATAGGRVASQDAETATAGAPTDASLSHTLSNTHLHESVPSLRTCMDDRQFYVKIASEKQKLNDKVRGLLHNRSSLRAQAGRVGPLPEPTPKQPELAVSKVATSTGWRQFGLGIGVPE